MSVGTGTPENKEILSALDLNLNHKWDPIQNATNFTNLIQVVGRASTETETTARHAQTLCNWGKIDYARIQPQLDKEYEIVDIHPEAAMEMLWQGYESVLNQPELVGYILRSLNGD